MAEQGAMMLRRSRFVHVVPLPDERALALHALTHLRLGIDAEVARLIGFFETPRALPAALAELERHVTYDRATLAGCIASLFERGVLTDKEPDEELAATAGALAQTGGRDPGEMLERFRRARHEGAQPYWALSPPRGIAALDGRRRRLDVLLLGDCDLQMEADFLRREGEARGLDLRIAASFPDDARLAGERAHDLIIVGALRSRGAIALAGAEDSEPWRPYLVEARRLLEALRAQSAAPILIDNLPEPTVQPLGLAERGPAGHRNRFRRANLALDEMVVDFADAHVVDIAAALAAAGAEALVDDGLTSFTHFGSPGWMLQRPPDERAAVHDLFPDPEPLAALVGGDPYRREKLTARAHADGLVSVLGVGAFKCVIVDLDGVLWPGVLAETGAPFAWSPEVSGPHSYIGLYFGIHEALKTLKRRGILLAAVSKNDEAIVRELWTYPDHYPHERLLKPDDFVTWRINWSSKADNIRAIAEELGLALDAFLFIDDHPTERERVRLQTPEVEAWGEELFTLRRRLLSDARLQRARLSRESEERTALVKAQLDRGRLRDAAPDEDAFLASLAIACRIERAGPDAALERVQELFQRTTQFNTTGRKFSLAGLAAAAARDDALIMTMKVSDRFADHGLVGAAIIEAGEIVALAMSCRVMGLGVEHRFLDAILTELAISRDSVAARIVETPRNLPVRNIYRDHGFERRPDGVWTRVLNPARDVDAA
jgi:FkbH-like protein